MTDPIRVEQGKLSDVLPDSQNANLHSARGQGVLERSLRKRGFFRPTAAFGKGVEHPVMGAGNLTQETAIAIGMDDAIFVYTDGRRPIVHVRTDIEPGSKEALALSLEDNRAAELSLNWSVEVIAGMSPEIIEGLWSPEELSTLGQQWADEHGGNGQDEQYSRKIESPVYEPKNEKPAVSELFDDAKTKTLLAAIEAATWLTDEERAFLTIAARRHTVIHYNKVADFYAHADAKLQALMEDSALVIIDFKRAIELGYVRLAEDIAKLYGEEYGTA